MLYGMRDWAHMHGGYLRLPSINDELPGDLHRHFGRLDELRSLRRRLRKQRSLYDRYVRLPFRHETLRQRVCGHERQFGKLRRVRRCLPRWQGVHGWQLQRSN